MFLGGSPGVRVVWFAPEGKEEQEEEKDDDEGRALDAEDDVLVLVVDRSRPCPNPRRMSEIDRPSLSMPSPLLLLLPRPLLQLGVAPYPPLRGLTLGLQLLSLPSRRPSLFTPTTR